MIRKFYIITGASVLIIGGYIVGYIRADLKSGKLMMEQSNFRRYALPKAELDFYGGLDSSQLLPALLDSGVYVLEIKMPTGQLITETIDLPFKNNQFAFDQSKFSGRVGMKESAKIEGHVVSWHHEGVLYDTGIEYVGVVSGSQMFGHVYNYQQTPEGEIALWRMFPKPPEPPEPPKPEEVDEPEEVE